MKALLIPDIHLGKGTNIGKDPVGVGLNSRIEDQKDLLDFITDYIKEKSIGYIFLMGDVWDSVNPKSSVVNVFCEWIKEITEYCEVNVIMGNHDFVRSGHEKSSMLDLFDVLDIPNCNIIKAPQAVQIHGLNFVCIPFTDRKQLEKNTHNEAVDWLKTELLNLKSDTSSNVVLGHLCLEGSLWVGDEIDEEINEIFCPLSIFEDYDQVWMGHVHKPQILKNNKNQIIGHVGSLDKTAFTGPDSTDKSMVMLEWETVPTRFSKSGRLRPNPFLKHYIVNLPTRPLVALDISVPSDCKDVNEFVYNEASKINVNGAIVRVTIKLGSYDADNVDKVKLLNLLNRNKAFHVCSYKEHKPVKKVIAKSAEVDETISSEKGVRVFIDGLDAEDDFKKDLMAFCKRIIKEVEGS
ncbi:MAG TPA: metallophosphoesterase [Candidatus Glassbacteria bacterium]|nr:metallophosphoesterase [Candidatus Glassbacteria bacterium]